MVLNCMVCVCVTFFGYENPDIRNHPRISSRIIVIIRSFGERDGSDKIDVRWGTTKNKISHLKVSKNCPLFEDVPVHIPVSATDLQC